jgi:hypothetical protein
MELVLALVLFIGLLASWLVLPGTAIAQAETTESEAMDLSHSVGQGA